MALDRLKKKLAETTDRALTKADGYARKAGGYARKMVDDNVSKKNTYELSKAQYKLDRFLSEHPDAIVNVQETYVKKEEKGTIDGRVLVELAYSSGTRKQKTKVLVVEVGELSYIEPKKIEEGVSKMAKELEGYASKKGVTTIHRVSETTLKPRQNDASAFRDDEDYWKKSLNKPGWTTYGRSVKKRSTA